MKVPPSKPSSAKGSRALSLGLAVALQLILLAGAVFIIVAVPEATPEPSFSAGKSITLPPRELDHRVAMAEYRQSAGMPLPVERLRSDELMPDALPSLRELPADSFSLMELAHSTPDAAAMLGETGLDAALEGLPQAGSAVDLFGIRDAATRLVILVDTSNSMFERQRDGVKYRFDFGVIKDEVASLIQGLQPDTLFNLAIYEGGSLAWQPELVPASLANKQAAEAWLRGLSESPGASISSRRSPGVKLLEGGGTRLDTGLRQVFGYEPQVVFIVTDGEINRSGKRIGEDEILRIIRELQADLPERARLHVVHYRTAVSRDVELVTMRAIASRNGGRFRQVKAEPL